MRVEVRIFKHKKFLLLIAEGPEESKALDLLCQGHYFTEKPHPVAGELKTDDWFNPYLSFDVS